MIKKITLVLAPLLLFLGFHLSHAPFLHWMELKSIDWRFALRGPIALTGEVVVVAIDDKSLAREGRWPWPREKMAQLISRVQDGKPAVVALDVIFSESAAGDAELGQAIKAAGNVMLGYYFYQTTDELAAAELSPEIAQQSFESIMPTALPERTTQGASLIEATGAVANVPLITNAALTQGYFNAFPDSDGTLRRFPLMLRYRGKAFPSMALELLSRHEDGFAPVLVASPAGVLKGVSVGARLVPTSSLGEAFVNYRGGADQFHILSATDVLNGKASLEGLRGKTVLVGATAVGIYDLRVTPISANFPGVLVAANLVDTLYRGDYLTQGEWVRIWDVVTMVLVGLALGWTLLHARLLVGVALTAAAIIIYGLVALWWFQHGAVVAMVTPILEWSCMAGAITIYRGLTEERQKRQIRRAFRAYLHPKIVEELTEHPETLRLGGQRMTCTILFCDVKNFSTISEKLEPEKLTQLMNAFFDPVCQAIMAEGGYVDKLIGDAVMAVFGAPMVQVDHAARACRAARSMQGVVRGLEPQLQRDFGVPEFKLRIGIHTGPVVVGNMGTRERLNYTVMGDAVNLASRLEGANKELGTDILASRATIDAAGPGIAARFVDTITVKGKEARIEVYTL